MTYGSMIVYKDSDWDKAVRFLNYRRGSEIPKGGIEVLVREPKHARSLSQNAISHVWYAEISKTLKEHTPEEVKQLCKLHFGVPIMRSDPEMSEMIEKILGPLKYEERLAAMDWLRVSSILSKPQMSHYLEDIQNHFAGKVRLEFP